MRASSNPIIAGVLATAAAATAHTSEPPVLDTRTHYNAPDAPEDSEKLTLARADGRTTSGREALPRLAPNTRVSETRLVSDFSQPAPSTYAEGLFFPQ